MAKLRINIVKPCTTMYDPPIVPSLIETASIRDVIPADRLDPYLRWMYRDANSTISTRMGGKTVFRHVEESFDEMVRKLETVDNGPVFLNLIGEPVTTEPWVKRPPIVALVSTLGIAGYRSLDDYPYYKALYQGANAVVQLVKDKERYFVRDTAEDIRTALTGPREGSVVTLPTAAMNDFRDLTRTLRRDPQTRHLEDTI